MDSQLKRGFIETCVLASMFDHDSYGYQIIKDIPEALDLSESTLYPVLRRLESAGKLTEYSIEHKGRLRKYYRITDEGRKQTTDFVAEWSDIVSIYEYVKRGTGDE